MAAFWCSEAAKAQYPIMQRLFFSVCSTRPDNAEAERDFSAFSSAPGAHGCKKPKTVARKLFLALNSTWRVPCPELENDNYYTKLLASIMVRPTSSRTATTPTVGRAGGCAHAHSRRLCATLRFCC